MSNAPPLTIVTESPFRNKAVDMGIPFEIAAQSMKDENESRDKIFRLIDVEK